MNNTLSSKEEAKKQGCDCDTAYEQDHESTPAPTPVTKASSEVKTESTAHQEKQGEILATNMSKSEQKDTIVTLFPRQNVVRPSSDSGI